MHRKDDLRQRSSPEATRPERHLAAFRERHPGAFDKVDVVYGGRGEISRYWPKWCFLPFEAAFLLLSGAGLPKSPTEVGDAFELCALAAWRATQGIYRPGPSLLEYARSMDLDWKIPGDLFRRLPEWCVYIETPGARPMGIPSAGFFAHLVTNSPDTRQLRLLFDVDDTPESRRIMGHPSIEGRPEGGLRLFPFAMDNATSDLREAAVAAFSNAATLPSEYWERPVSGELRQAAQGIDIDRIAYQFLLPTVLLDRICSPTTKYRDAAGSTRQPGNPASRRKSHGNRKRLLAREATVWDVD